MNYAVKDFLRTRLHLETSEEKSKVINLKKNSSEFLGFSIKAKKKGKTRFGYVAKSSMTKKAKTNARTLQKRYKGYQAQLYKIQEMVFVPTLKGVKQTCVLPRLPVTILSKAEQRYIKTSKRSVK